MVLLMLLVASYAFAKPASSEVYVMGDGEIIEVFCAHPVVDFSPEQKLIIECLQAAELPTAVPTETAVSPSATNTQFPTATHTPAPTETAVSPTITNTPLPTPTNTPLPTPTNTPIPTPIPTPTHT
ncbi:MAG: hypothetical protein DWQ04_16970, partial [Chloroflexi bacterium]